MSESPHPVTPETQTSESQARDAAATDKREERLEVRAARAQADSQIEKARRHRETSARKEAWILVLAGLSATAAALCFCFWLLGQKDSEQPQISGWWPVGTLTLSFILSVVWSVRAADRSAAYEEVVREEELGVRLVELDFVQDADAPLSANRELLREYHRLSTSQARSAFRLAIWVMASAAVLILVGAGAVVVSQNTTTAITLGSLTAFISALGGYVSSTLLATYRVSVEQARFYFREPLAGGYLLAAEHLARRLDGPEQTAALGRVVDGFVQAATNVPGTTSDAPPQEAAPQGSSATA